MTAAPSLPEPRIVAWTGRQEGAWPDGVDGWSHDRVQTLELLDGADLLLLIDPPSFHYQMLNAVPALPFVAVIPPELPAEVVVDLLGRPLLRRVTPFDRIIVDRPEVREACAEEHEIPDDAWVVGMDPDWPSTLRAVVEGLGPLRALGTAKSEWHDRCERLAAELRAGLYHEQGADEAHWATKPWVAVDGESVPWRRRLQGRAWARALTLDEVLATPPADDFAVVTPDAVVLVLPDGAQPSAERTARLRAAFDVLPPGGQLLIEAHVVDTDEGLPNPSIGQLIEEIHDATGTAVHLESMTSVRERGARHTRGVMLRYTSLKVGEALR